MFKKGGLHVELGLLFYWGVQSRGLLPQDLTSEGNKVLTGGLPLIEDSFYLVQLRENNVV